MLIREKYKTYEGARKRAAFENALAPGEFARGEKARLYHYKVVPDPRDSTIFRVERTRKDATAA